MNRQSQTKWNIYVSQSILLLQLFASIIIFCFGKLYDQIENVWNLNGRECKSELNVDEIRNWVLQVSLEMK